MFSEYFDSVDKKLIDFVENLNFNQIGKNIKINGILDTVAKSTENKQKQLRKPKKNYNTDSMGGSLDLDSVWLFVFLFF